MIGGASGEIRNTGSAAASSAWACLLLFVLVFVGALIGAVSLIFIGACFSAKPQSLAGPATPVGTILAVRWPNKGWSRPVLPDHGELAASEQAQLEAARARRGWRPIRRALTSQFNTSTHRRRHLGESTTQVRRSSLDIFPQSLDASAELHPRAYIFATTAVDRINNSVDDISCQRSTPARPDYYPGRRNAERALVKAKEADRILAKAMARMPAKVREVKRAQAKAQAAEGELAIARA